jgi:hypothetical protein
MLVGQNKASVVDDRAGAETVQFLLERSRHLRTSGKK